MQFLWIIRTIQGLSLLPSISATKSIHNGEMVLSCCFLFIYTQTTAAGTVQKKRSYAENVKASGCEITRYFYTNINNFPRDAQENSRMISCWNSCTPTCSTWCNIKLKKSALKAVECRWHFISRSVELLCIIHSFCPRSANSLQKTWCLLAFRIAQKHTAKTGAYIYLATISVFLIWNGLYLTTVYGKVSDPNISCTVSVLA